MNDHGFWASWQGEAPTFFIILTLALLNIVFLYVAWVQKRLRRKIERDLLAVQTFGSAYSFTAKSPLKKEQSHLQTATHETVAGDACLLKIDKAIAMLKKGSALEEIKTALDIETSYLKILATHHAR